jgi:hypothetical protein
MKFEHALTSNWQNAFRGLRHPMESYAKSDSLFGIAPCDWLDEPFRKVYQEWKNKWYQYHDSDYDEPFNEIKVFNWLDSNYHINYDPSQECYEYALLGPNDLDLAQRMIKAGTPNDKFLRQIFVSVDITAPLYLWKEIDQYKVGTITNSTSTMHKLASTPITKECFEIDDYKNIKLYDKEPYNPDTYMDDVWNELIEVCEVLRKRFLETKDIRYWKELIRILPESWLQTRTWTANYAILRNIVYWRKNHKLKYEWDSFIQWCQTLPYSSELIFYNNGYENGYELHNLLSSK